MQGLLIHVGEYLEPAAIDMKNPTEYALKYARFSNDKVSTKGELHIDPEFDDFTYGDDPQNRAKRNLGKMQVGDYIFFMWTFIEKPSMEKRRYIPGYIRIREKLTVREILQNAQGNTRPYSSNAHVRDALKGRQKEETKFMIYVGDSAHSKKCKIPLLLDKNLIGKMDLRNSLGEAIASKIGTKRHRNGKPMSEIEVINVYTRIPKVIDETQVQIILEAMGHQC